MFTTTSAGQVIAGFSVSSTVTIASHVATLPSLSVTVKVTVFGPTIEQSKAVIEAAKEAIPQLSVEPPSISAATIVALPAASNVTVMSEHKATGATLSSTVTIASHVETLPLGSVTIKGTVFAPIFAQSKVNWLPFPSNTNILEIVTPAPTIPSTEP